MMDFYTYNFLFFLVVNAALSYPLLTQASGFLSGWRTYVPLKKAEAQPLADTTFSVFKKKFLLVYLLVFAADWLQVVYIVMKVILSSVLTILGALHLHPL